MGIFDKVKNFIDNSDEDTIDEDIENVYERIVILNLETCPADDSRRIIDFLSGVAYANSGDIKKVAGKAYIITPDSVPLSGDVLEDIESMSEGYFD